MLHEFVAANRIEIIDRCRAKIASRPVPRPTDVELEHGVPLFLDQLLDSLRSALGSNPAMVESAAKHGNELLLRGFTVAQVVHDYGGICQAITELAVETHAAITASDFKTLNSCLDDAIAGAVTEYARLREYQGTERLGLVAHELRNLLSTAVLAFDTLKTGSVGIGGSTGAVLGRSLAGLGNLIDRQLTEVRLGAGVQHLETFALRDFIEDIEIAASMEAKVRGLRFLVMRVPPGVMLRADRQILASVVGNLLQNAFKFSRPGGQVVLCAHSTDTCVIIDVADQCGGLPAGKAEELFRPFQQAGTDRSGLGLGLTICERGVRLNGGEISVLNEPGIGCIFSVNLPKQTAPPVA